MTSSTPDNSRARNWWMQACSAILIVIVVAWGVGRVVSDQYGWSQWLFWIPTPAVLVGLLIGSLMHQGRTRLAWVVTLLVAGAYFAVGEHRFLQPGGNRTATSLRLAHWTVSHIPRKDEYDQHVDAIIDIESDITFITHGGAFTASPRLQQHFGREGRPPSLGYFKILSRYPILELRELIAVDDIFVVMVEFETSTRPGQNLVVYLIDLPSNPGEPRMALATRVRRLLDSVDAPAPDVLIGDFNLTRDGVAIETIAGSLRHAYHDAGRGHGASYHRQFPLLHIDHAFVSDRIHVHSYILHDPGIGRHRMQVTDIEMRDELGM